MFLFGSVNDFYPEDSLSDSLGQAAPQAAASPAPTVGPTPAQQIQREVQRERYFVRLRRTAQNRIGSLNAALDDRQKRMKLLTYGSVMLTFAAAGVGYWMGTRKSNSGTSSTSQG